MRFPGEAGFTIPRGANLVLGLPESGQGKATGAYTVLPHLGDIPVIRPSEGGLLTRTIWGVAHQQYLRNGEPGTHQERYDVERERGIPEWKIRLANREIVSALGRSGAHLLSMHGIFGYGADRTVLEIDRKVEASVAAPRTRALVPLPETREELFQKGKERGLEQEIEVVGFLVPDQLKDTERKSERAITLSQSAPTKDNPLRLAFMTTGQFGHMSVLENQILGDEQMRRAIQDGTMKLDVYMWNDEHRANAVGSAARELGLRTIVTPRYLPDPEQEVGVQVFYNQNTEAAVTGSMQMAARADIVASAIAERVGWTLEQPFIALPPVGYNAKMTSNTEWAVDHGLALPAQGQGFSEIIPVFFGPNGEGEAHRENTHAVRTVFLRNTNQDITAGAATAAKYVHELVSTL